VKFEFKGFDISKLEYAVKAYVEDIEDDIERVLERIVDDAMADMIRILETAQTPTGEARVAAGKGIIGRVNEGKMRAAIERALSPMASGGVAGEWGWLDEVEKYYDYQEYGTGKIGPMNALQDSFIHARERFREELRSLGLEVA
jgi:hypothetical protein